MCRGWNSNSVARSRASLALAEFTALDYNDAGEWRFPAGIGFACECGGVAELADAHDLGSCLLRGEGSSPSFPIVPEEAHRSASHFTAVCAGTAPIEPPEFLTKV
jgi:hypothetical protein